MMTKYFLIIFLIVCLISCATIQYFIPAKNGHSKFIIEQKFKDSDSVFTNYFKKRIQRKSISDFYKIEHNEKFNEYLFTLNPGTGLDITKLIYNQIVSTHHFPNDSNIILVKRIDENTAPDTLLFKVNFETVIINSKNYNYPLLGERKHLE